MELPARLTVHCYTYALDGGTTELRASDESGREHLIRLVQHAFPERDRSDGEIPGRLYFDGELVPMRSDFETGVLALLRAADVRYLDPLFERGERFRLPPDSVCLGEDIRRMLTRGPEENIRALIAEAIGFVESVTYLQFAASVEQAADPTRYTVWAAGAPANRDQVAAPLARVLRTRVQAARRLLESGEPLAEGVSAPEVLAMVERYAREGLALRVEPAFPWPLDVLRCRREPPG